MLQQVGRCPRKDIMNICFRPRQSFPASAAATDTRQALYLSPMSFCGSHINIALVIMTTHSSPRRACASSTSKRNLKPVIPRTRRPAIIRSCGLPAWNSGTEVDYLNAAICIGLAASIPIVVETAMRNLVSQLCNSWRPGLLTHRKPSLLQ